LIASRKRPASLEDSRSPAITAGVESPLSDRVVLGLVGVDQGRKHIEPIALRCSGAGTPKPINLCEGSLVIRLAADWLDFVHDDSQGLMTGIRVSAKSSTLRVTMILS
jgi:hypothetical protein